MLGVANCPPEASATETAPLVHDAGPVAVAAERSPGDDPSDSDPEEIPRDIIVTAALQRGSVRTVVPAEIRVERIAIMALGADSLADVIDAYAPQARSFRSGDAPVVLLDGRRIASRSEIAVLPPEAILRLEIFPEEVALQYGYLPDRRVINVILRPKYRVVELQARYDLPLGDALSAYSGKVQFLDLSPTGRVNLDFGNLRQGKRVDRSGGEGPDERSEHPASDRFAANGTFARRFEGHDVTFTAAGNWQVEHLRLGRGSDGSGLRGRETTARESFGVTIGAKPGRWFWSATGQVRFEREQIVVHGVSRNLVAVPEYSGRGYTRDLKFDFTTSGPFGKVGGLDLLGTVGGGAGAERHEARNPVTGGTGSMIQRDSAHVLGSLQLSLNARKDAVVSLEGKLETASGQGILGRHGFGLRAEPLRGLTLSTAYSSERALPEFASLAGTQILTPNVRVYDFRSGSTGYVEQWSGGNPQLWPRSVRTVSVRMQFAPAARPNLSVTLDFSDLSVRNGTSGPLMPSPQVEAALPERFERTSAGTLVRFDRRPINIAREDRRQLRWGINQTVPIARGIPSREEGPSQEEGAGDIPAEDQPDRSQGEFPPRVSGLARASALPRAQLQFGLYHTWTLASTAVLAPRSPRIDLLRGAAVQFPGGSPEHRVDLQLGYASRYFGVRLSGNWQTASDVADIALPKAAGTHRLIVRPPVRLDMRIFLNLAKAGDGMGVPGLSGRLHLQIDNLLDSTTSIRDENKRRVHFYRDFDRESGRTIHLTFRKLIY